MGIGAGWAAADRQVFAMTTDDSEVPGQDTDGTIGELASDDPALKDKTGTGSGQSVPDLEASGQTVYEVTEDTETKTTVPPVGVETGGSDASEGMEPADGKSDGNDADQNAGSDSHSESEKQDPAAEDSASAGKAATSGSADSASPERTEAVSAGSPEKNAETASQPQKTAARASVLNGWVSNKYYVNGTAATGEVRIGSDRHLFDNDGNPLSGFMYYDGVLLYCNSQGKVTTGTFTVEKQTFTTDTSGKIVAMNSQNVPYLMQTDPRWSYTYIGGRTVGSTGCVMATAASVINFFNNTSYTPVQIGIAMNQAGYYNASGEGTSSDVWSYIAGQYGLTYKNNLGLDGIIRSLLEGNIVVGAVGYSQWCPYFGATHELYMTGYNNGKVQLYDPLHSNMCGTFSLTDVWNVRSTDPMDNRQNGPFYAIGKRSLSTINSDFAKYGTVMIGDQAYTGSRITAKPVVGIQKNGSCVQLQEGKDYTLEFGANTSAGTGTVTVIGKGLYKGRITRDFYIVNNKVADSVYTIASAGNTGLFLDVVNGSRTGGTQIQLYAGNGSDAQRFAIRRLASGYYTIQNVNSGLYLGTSPDWKKIGNGLKVTQQAYRNDQTCQWMIRATSGGYVFTSAWNTMWVLDVPSASFRSGERIQIYDRNGSKAQAWRLTDLNAGYRELDQLAAASRNAVADGFYTISSQVDPAKVLDVNGAGTANGTNVQLYAANGTQAQLFQVFHVGDYIRIVNSGSGKVLDVNGAGIKDGTNVQIYDWNGSRAQLWIPVATNNGIKLVSALGKNLVLDLNGALAQNGRNVTIYSSNDTKAQRWIFRKAEDPRAVLDRMAAASKNYVAAGRYEIHSVVNGGYNLDVTSAAKTNGANVQLYADNDSGAQRWNISYDAKGYALIQNVNSGQYLSLASSQAQSGVNIVQSSSAGLAQKWIFTVSGNTIQIVSALSQNYVLDLSGAHAVNGRNIQLYAANNTNAQKWRFVKV